MGDDGIDGEMTSASMYVDMVERKFAKNSCDPVRYDIEGEMTSASMYYVCRYGRKKKC